MTVFLIDAASWVLIVSGSLFGVAAGIGILRFPDFYTRLHAAGVSDTMGAWLLLFGLMLQAGLSQATIKLALIVVFLFFTSPTATHALARAALTEKNQDRNETSPAGPGADRPPGAERSE